MSRNLCIFLGTTVQGLYLKKICIGTICITEKNDVNMQKSHDFQDSDGNIPEEIMKEPLPKVNPCNNVFMSVHRDSVPENPPEINDEIIRCYGSGCFRGDVGIPLNNNNNNVPESYTISEYPNYKES